MGYIDIKDVVQRLNQMRKEKCYEICEFSLLYSYCFLKEEKSLYK